MGLKYVLQCVPRNRNIAEKRRVHRFLFNKFSSFEADNTKIISTSDVSSSRMLIRMIGIKLTKRTSSVRGTIKFMKRLKWMIKITMTKRRISMTFLKCENTPTKVNKDACRKGCTMFCIPCNMDERKIMS